MHGLRIQGSLVASRGTQIKMLRFGTAAAINHVSDCPNLLFVSAALHDIKPVVQTFPMSVEGINEAVRKELFILTNTLSFLVLSSLSF